MTVDPDNSSTSPFCGGPAQVIDVEPGIFGVVFKNVVCGRLRRHHIEWLKRKRLG
jgi:hypothetical protein